MYELELFPQKKSFVLSVGKSGFRSLKICENFLFEHIRYCLGNCRKDYKPYASAKIYEVKKGEQKWLVRNIVFIYKSDIIEKVAI